MRFIHTADWHLGRLFHGIHLTEDQSHVLEQFCDLAREARVDAVIIAGDVYDRAVPPPEAIALLDETLSRIVIDCGVPVIMIAGNHDSPERLSFGSRVLADRGLHILGRSSAGSHPVVLGDDHGPVSICPIPYAEPSLIRSILGDDAVTDHSTAMQALCNIARGERAEGSRSIAVAHAFVLGGEMSDSERPLSIGGSEAVESSVFNDFDYVALGHLHRAQGLGDDRQHISYSGSLLKYSFSEVNHAKSVKVIEMDAKGNCSAEQISLSPRRDVRRITGTINEMLERPEDFGNKGDYLVARLTDEGAVYEPLIRLREVFPNIMDIERTQQLTGKSADELFADHRKMSDLELFESFFSFVNDGPLSDDQKELFVSVVDRLRATEREATP